MFPAILILSSIIGALSTAGAPDSRTIDIAGGVQSLSASSDGSLIAVRQESETALWSLDNGSELSRFPGFSVQFLETGNLLVIEDEGVLLRGGRDWTDRVDFLPWRRRSEQLRFFAFSPSPTKDACAVARTMANSTSRVTIISADGPDSLRESAAFTTICPDINAIAMSSDGLVAVACESTGMVEIYSPAGDKLQAYPALGIPAPSPGGYRKGELSFVAGSRFLASTHFDNRLRVWDLQVRAAVPLVQRDGQVTGLMSTPDGTYLLTLEVGQGMGTLVVWTLPDFEILGEMRGEYGATGAMTFAKPNRWIVSGFRTEAREVEMEDGSIRQRTSKVYCLRVFDWEEILSGLLQE